MGDDRTAMLAFILLLLLSGATIVSCHKFVGTEVEVFRFDDASSWIDIVGGPRERGDIAKGLITQAVDEKIGIYAYTSFDRDGKSTILGGLPEIYWFNKEVIIKKPGAVVICRCIDKSDTRRQNIAGIRSSSTLVTSTFYTGKQKTRVFFLSSVGDRTGISKQVPDFINDDTMKFALVTALDLATNRCDQYDIPWIPQYTTFSKKPEIEIGIAEQKGNIAIFNRVDRKLLPQEEKRESKISVRELNSEDPRLIALYGY